MQHLARGVLPAVAVMAALAGTLSTPDVHGAARDAAGSELREARLRSAAIARNLLGEPAEQTVLVYLPASYASQPERRYPVVYLLHGIADSPQTWTTAWQLPKLLDELMKAGRISEMIVVMPNGRNRLLGSYYLNSPVTGGWEDFIKAELVAYVDSTYRTVTDRKSRAVAGISMGGFGALQLAMRAADVFAVAYAASPCCLDFVEDVGYGSAAWRGALGFRAPADVFAAAERGEFYPVAAYGLVAATLPEPEHPPLFINWPVRNMKGDIIPDAPVWDRWRETAPVRLVSHHAASLRSLKALAIDFGVDDQFAHIPPATAAFSRALADYRVPHRLEVFAGDHRAQIKERLATRMFPFLSESLEPH